MAEIIQKDGTWTFDGDSVRIVPGRDKGVGLLRQTLGEVAVPLRALAGISYEPGRKAGRLRLRLRDGADPLLQVTGGRLPEDSDPYRLTVEPDRAGVAEYFVDEVRNALLLDQVDPGPADSYLLPGPPVPITVGAGDGTVAFDGDRVALDWNWTTEEAKRSGGAPSGAVRALAPKQEPTPAQEPAQAPAPADHDALLRRLRELGELHQAGILTPEEFSAAKAAILGRF